MTVVVGVDDSGHALTVLQRAISEARRRDTELDVVHVFHPPVLPYMGVPIDMGALADAERTAVWRPLDPELARSGIDYEKVDLEGYPADCLIGYAANVDADLLVVGSRGRGEFASLVLGSTSHRSIHLAHCDVLVVKEGTGGGENESASTDSTAGAGSSGPSHA